MKASEVKPPPESIVKPFSPNVPVALREYAVEAGGMVLNPTRYATAEDAYFWGCLVKNAQDRERCGHIMVSRKVVSREVSFGEWKTISEDEIKV